MTKAYPYQLKGVKLIRQFNGRALLADEMGLGKTLQSLLYIQEKDAFPAIVICPACLKYNWQAEVRKHLGIRADIFETTKPHAWSSFTRHKIAIINYDILEGWMPYLKKMKRRLKVKTVIVDECKEIKSSTSKRNKLVRKVCARIPNVIMIDGTPLTNRPIELYPALHILRPDIFDSRFAYGTTYCEGTVRNGKWEYRGATNLDKLHELLKESCMIRRRKADVLKDLPAKSRYVVPLEIENRKEYEKATSDFFGWLAKFGGVRKVMAAHRADAFVQLGYWKRLAAELKLKAIKEWIDNWFLTTDEKLIVFGVHKKILRPLKERYKDLSVFVDGSVTSHKRHLAIEQFNRDKRCRLGIGNIKAFGQGWSATSCSTTCHIEIDWVPARHTQGEDRVHGIGRGVKGKAAFAYYLVAHDTIEESLCSLVQKKQKIISAVLDGDEDIEDFDIFDALLLELNKEKKNGSK